MKSIGAKIQQLQGLVGTRDLNAWEREFVVHVGDLTQGGRDTTRLSDLRVEKVGQIYAKHFGDAAAA
jgi:hypothetical protein